MAVFYNSPYNSVRPGGIGYQVADTGPVGWVNFWPGCSLVPKY